MKYFSLKFQAEGIEDFHSGDGLGKLGLYDQGQQAELVAGKRNPVVRSDTFKGLLRECCFRLSESEHYRKEWESRFPGIDLEMLRRAVFEYGGGDSLLFTSLRPAAQSENPFRIITQTAIETTGMVKKRSLRSIECGRSGLVLEGEIRGRFAPDLFDAATSFLLDGLLAFRRLGGSRRRGLGRIRLREKPQVETLPISRVIEKPSIQSQGPIHLFILLRAVEPLHITRGTQVGNLVRCMNRIPGSVFLGALRHEWRLDSRTESKMPREAAELLGDYGKTSYGDFFPLPEDALINLHESTSLADLLPEPVPLSWQYPKGKNGKCLDDLDVRCTFWDPKEQIQLKRLDGYYRIGDWIYKPPMETVLRNQISRTTGRVEENNLFAMETIPAGTRFIGRMTFAGKGDLDLFLETFAHLFAEQDGAWIGIGRGRKPVRIERWEAVPIAAVQDKAPDQFSLNVVAPIFGYDKFCNGTTGIMTLLMQAIPDFPYAMKQPYESLDLWRRFSPIGGLAAFPIMTLAPGSCFHFERDPSGDTSKQQAAWNALRALEANRGLGEGFTFGLGRFSLEPSRPDFSALRNQRPELAQETVLPKSNRERIIQSAQFFFNSNKEDIPDSSQWHLLINTLNQSREQSPQESIRRFTSRTTYGGRKWKGLLKTKNNGQEVNLLIHAVSDMDRQAITLFIETVIRLRELHFSN